MGLHLIQVRFYAKIKKLVLNISLDNRWYFPRQTPLSPYSDSKEQRVQVNYCSQNCNFTNLPSGVHYQKRVFTSNAQKSVQAISISKNLFGGLRSWSKVVKQNNNLSSLSATYPTQCQENTFTIRGTNTCNKKL